MQMIQKPLSNYNHSRQILAQKPLFWTLFAIAGLPKRLLLYRWSVAKRFKILFQWEKVKWHIKFRLNRKREIKCDTNYFGSPFSELELECDDLWSSHSSSPRPSSTPGKGHRLLRPRGHQWFSHQFHMVLDAGVVQWWRHCLRGRGQLLFDYST